MRSNNILEFFENSSELFNAAAEDFVHRAQKSLEEKETFSVVLSGGNTAKDFFDVLVKFEDKIAWDRIHFFWGDERYVSHDDPQSNFFQAREHLFDKLPIPFENIHPIPTEIQDPEHCAQEYEKLLLDCFNLDDSPFPRFDLLYLGLGDNAHTASLFPHQPLPDNQNQLVFSQYIDEVKMFRISLTPQAINHSHSIIFLVTGENKAKAVQEVLEGPFIPEAYPAQLIDCINQSNIWYLDNDAAKKLSGA